MQVQVSSLGHPVCCFVCFCGAILSFFPILGELISMKFLKGLDSLFSFDCGISAVQKFVSKRCAKLWEENQIKVNVRLGISGTRQLAYRSLRLLTKFKRYSSVQL